MLASGYACFGASTASANQDLPATGSPQFHYAVLTPSIATLKAEARNFQFAAQPRLDVAYEDGGGSQWYNRFTSASKQGRKPTLSVSRGKFDAVARRAALSPVKLASILNLAQRMPSAEKEQASTISHDDPATRRLASAFALAQDEKPIVLAYADPSPDEATGALAAISRMAPGDVDETSDAPIPGLPEEALLLPDEEDIQLGGEDEYEAGELPDSGPMPGVRPRGEKSAPKPETVEGREEQKTVPPDSVARRPETKRDQLALARPDDPSADRPGIGRALKNLFGGTRAGDGVAVYDISAARVYMPDGSVLEAHSGIGKMADNPRYTHVRMNGSTPPHTYNLRMRESRFHGVEAIRMLPVDGKNPHGRTGLLTHSYLLRGGRAESHGCVAFKDYKRFLTAFKKGHVKQLVVVSSGGRAVARSSKKGGTDA